jgi:hypothetical protein
MFKEVPLINIDTKTINIKVPSLTSDDINKYTNYLKLRMVKNEAIVTGWTETINEVLGLCGTTDKQEAAATKTRLQTEKIAIANGARSPAEKENLNTWIDSEIKNMDEIIASTEVKTAKEMGADTNNLSTNATNTAKKLGNLPYWKKIQVQLAKEKLQKGDSFPKEDQERLDTINTIVGDMEKCAGIA